MNTPQLDISGLAITSLFTILGGVLIFVLGQIIIKFIIEPLYEQSKLIGEIATSLIYYINLTNNGRFSGKDKDESSIVLRKQASDLMGRTYAIPMYGLWSLLGRPRLKEVIQASEQLISLSEVVDEHDCDKIIKTARCLKIKVITERFKR